MEFLLPIEATISITLNAKSKEAEELQKTYDNGDRTTILSELGFPGEYVVVKQEIWPYGDIKPGVAVAVTLQLIEL